MTLHPSTSSGQTGAGSHKVDLHLHTTYSDGTLNPTELIDVVAAAGLQIVAITDHDSTEGLEEALHAAGRHPQLTVIPGVELSTEVSDGEIHVLAYYVDRDDAAFQRSLVRFRELRVGRGEKMVEKLTALGAPVSFGRVLELAGDGAIGRPHVARALVERGHVSNTQEAFGKYLALGRPAYVKRDKLTPEQAIRLAVDNGALPVLAHPSYVPGLEERLGPMTEAGLVGMEAHYGGYSGRLIEELLAMAQRFGLIPCGGSDYHAMGREGETRPGEAGPPLSTVEELASIREQRRRHAGATRP